LSNRHAGLMVVIGHLEYLGALDRLVALLDSAGGSTPPLSSAKSRMQPAGASAADSRADIRSAASGDASASVEDNGAATILWRVCLLSGGLSAAVTNDTACLVCMPSRAYEEILSQHAPRLTSYRGPLSCLHF
jgi:hypothetical protein